MSFFKSNRVIAMDIGAAQLKLAEFTVIKAGIELTNLAVCPMGIEPGSETDPTMAIIDAIQGVLKEKSIQPGPVVLSVTGQSAFRAWSSSRRSSAIKFTRPSFTRPSRTCPSPWRKWCGTTS